LLETSCQEGLSSDQELQHLRHAGTVGHVGCRHLPSTVGCRHLPTVGWRHLPRNRRHLPSDRPRRRAAKAALD
jgi:hypothetical protein